VAAWRDLSPQTTAPDFGRELMSHENTLPPSLAERARRALCSFEPLSRSVSTLPLTLLFAMLGRLREGQLRVRLPDGSVRHFRGDLPGPEGVLHIHDSRLVMQTLRGGAVGLSEAYLDGRWDSPDLTTLLCVLYANERHLLGPFESHALGRALGYLGHQLRRNTRRMARRNIGHHYDLGNDFYRLWLDPTMAYSSAVFEEPDQPLQAAQENKFRLMLERLELRAEHELLEIGSGWGGFAIYAAQRTGCRVHSITLSQEQLTAARQRAAEAGVADRVHFELRDYRDLQRRYDRIVSIEMIEAVGEAWWPTYFQTIRQALRPQGIAAIQGITIDARIFPQYRRQRDFIQKYIFPGGMLAPPERWMAIAAAAGLKSEAPAYYGLDYARTLRHWHVAVLENADAISGQFDARFLRMWRYYLSYCECGFLAGSTDLMQLTLRPDS